MRKKHTKFMVALLISIMCLTMIAPMAQAAESPKVTIPVSVTLTGAPQLDSEDYEIVVEADDPAYPMPAGSENGVYKLIITGANMVTLPVIEFPSLGIYTYTISQTPGTNDLGNYDDRVYNITVYITNAEDGSGLQSTVIAQQASEEAKLDELEFINDYEIELPDEETPGGEVELPDEEIPGGEAEPTDPPHEPEKSDVPKTGDNTMIWLYIALFVGAGILLLVLALTRKKKAE